MARQLRLEYPGALYHITARGNARQAIYLDNHDRHQFLALLGDEVEQQHWRCYAYGLMENHYHLLLETPEANLSCGMRRLNGRYTQDFNRRYQQVGQVLRAGIKAFWWKRRPICWSSAGILSSILCGPNWCDGSTIGGGAAIAQRRGKRMVQSG